MALQLTYTSQAGLTATNAYHRVEGVSIDGKTKIKFHVQQAYEHLKTLPEFAGATDV